MKFCYLDESGTGDEPYAVMVGVIADAQRMHITKEEWAKLLELLSKLAKKPVLEFHARDFYSGKGPWYGLDGDIRSRITSAIFGWLSNTVVCPFNVMMLFPMLILTRECGFVNSKGA